MSPHESDGAGMAHLETYLSQVSRHLQSLPNIEIAEIIAELRSHVLDKVAGSLTPQAVEAAITALGSPREVARLNLTERVAAELDEDRSPLTVLRGVGRLAGLSLYGAFTGLVCFTGYALAASFLITAAVKPFWGDHAGLWRVPDPNDTYAFSLGVNSSPRGEELLGWWIIPIGIGMSVLLAWLTWRFGIFSVRLMRRTAQRARS